MGWMVKYVRMLILGGHMVQQYWALVIDLLRQRFNVWYCYVPVVLCQSYVLRQFIRNLHLLVPSFSPLCNDSRAAGLYTCAVCIGQHTVQ